MNIVLHVVNATVGCTLNAQCGTNLTTALMEATKHGNLDMMKLLIQRGAQVNAGDKDKDTALHIAAVFKVSAKK